MKALSVKQPYAWLLLQRAYEDDSRQCLKPIENRRWPMPRTLVLPQRILIHASLGFYDVSLSELKELMTLTQWLRCRTALHAIYSLWDLYRSDTKRLARFSYFGHILGSVAVTGQVTESTNPFFFGPFGFAVEYPELLTKPMPYKGKLGFFEVNLPQEARHDVV